MENVADALKMAAAVLVFVIALSISINAFGEARRTSQIIINYQDKEYEYSYVQESTDSFGNIITERTVGIESIIPTIYKAYKENYKIIFKDLILYKKADTSSTTVDIYKIDLENDVLGSDTEKEKFLEALLFGPSVTERERYAKSGIFFLDEGLYKRIENKKFKESLGVYYQEEIQGETNTPDANKTEKRVITYEEI